jgi:hypothetical protein
MQYVGYKDQLGLDLHCLYINFRLPVILKNISASYWRQVSCEVK